MLCCTCDHSTISLSRLCALAHRYYSSATQRKRALLTGTAASNAIVIAADWSVAMARITQDLAFVKMRFATASACCEVQPLAPHLFDEPWYGRARLFLCGRGSRLGSGTVFAGVAATSWPPAHLI